ncbi:MAG: ECF transporter S component [Christensenellales bacterium]|jgi:riboflavin transporter FmnP
MNTKNCEKIQTTRAGARYGIKTLARVGILSALAFVFMLVEFPLPLMPPWLKIDLGDIPALLGSFAIGPVAGVVIEFIKNLLFMIVKNSGTGGVGEMANFLLGVALVVPAGIIYRRNHCRAGALKGMLVGLVSFTLVGAALNYFVLLPLYMSFAPNLLDGLAGITPWIHDRFTYVLYGATPFNIIKGIVVMIITYVVYKPISGFLSSGDKRRA